MNIRNTILSVLFASLGAAVAQEHGTAAKTRHLDPRPLARAAKVGLTKAIRTALELQPGTAVQAEIEGEVSGGATTVFYEVMILDSEGHAHEVLVDPQSGAGTVKESQEPAEEIAAFRKMARKAKLSLEAMTKSAGKLVRGKAMAAKLELEDDAVEAHIVFTAETHDLTVVIEAATGKVEEIECRATEAGRGSRNEDEDEEDDAKGEHGEKGDEGKANRSKKPVDGTGKHEGEDADDEVKERASGRGAGQECRGTKPARERKNDREEEGDEEKEGKAKGKRGK